MDIKIPELFTKDIPPFVKKFAKFTGKGINRYKMISENDKILLGISGGKDSLALALALSLRRRWLPINYDLKAVMIEWREYPIKSEESRKALIQYFKDINIDFEIIQANINPDSFKGKFNCYLCSRNRKRILFNIAANEGIKKVALGHHLDDIAATTLINICFRGNISTMMPVQNFFDEKLQIIRPMCEVEEKMVSSICRNLNLPVHNLNCPFKSTNLRLKIKPIIDELYKHDKHVKEHIYNAPMNINKNYIPEQLK